MLSAAFSGSLKDGCIGPKSTAFYELRAKGGAAAVTVSELMVHPQTDGSHAYHLDESILNSLAAATYTADAIRRHGAIPSLELSHSGQFAGTYMTDKSRQHGLCQWGPSEGMRPDGVPVKALTQERIDDIHHALYMIFYFFAANCYGICIKVNFGVFKNFAVCAYRNRFNERYGFSPFKVLNNTAAYKTK